MYPANVNEDKILSRSHEFVPAKSSNFDVFKVTHMGNKKNASFAFLKRIKMWKWIIYVFLLHRNRCNLSHYRRCSLSPLFCIITIQLFWPIRLCHLPFVTLTHAVWYSGALYIWFLPFVTSASAICLCPVLAQVILLYVTMTFLRWFMLFRFVGLASFCHDNRCSLSFLGTSKWELVY